MTARERILIVRTSAMGDIVHALPVLTRLRTAFPDARIAWVVERAFAPLLEGHPWIDRLIPVALRTWRRQVGSSRTWRELADFTGAVHEFSPEIVLDLMGSHKAGAIAASTLADRRIGLARPWRREPSSSIWLSETVAASGRHVVDQMRSVVAGLDPDAESGPIDFGGEHLPSAPWTGGPPPGEEFALLHPRTAWRNKDYPEASWAEVARGLRERSGLAIWVA